MSNLSYDFTFLEVKKLVQFFRQKDIPVELENFFSCIESHIYNNMTIEEAEHFLNEK